MEVGHKGLRVVKARKLTLAPLIVAMVVAFGFSGSNGSAFTRARKFRYSEATD